VHALLQKEAPVIYEHLHDAVLACEKKRAKEALIETLALMEGEEPNQSQIDEAAEKKTKQVMSSFALFTSSNQSYISPSRECEMPLHIQALYEQLSVERAGHAHMMGRRA
jgi:hypothetical protein